MKNNILFNFNFILLVVSQIHLKNRDEFQIELVIIYCINYEMFLYKIVRKTVMILRQNT